MVKGRALPRVSQTVDGRAGLWLFGFAGQPVCPVPGLLTPALPLEGPRDGGKDVEGGWGMGPSLKSALGAAGESGGHKQGGRWVCD